MTDIMEVNENIRACKKCTIRSECTQVVLGRGRYDHPIAFVGEAPREQEDLQGLPFVGRSGKLLARLMARLGHPDAFVTNIVRCRPPNNRKPTDEEVSNCSEWTWKELKYARHITCLGRTAQKALFGDTWEWGTWKHMSGPDGFKHLLSAWHPSYVLRTGKYKEWLAQFGGKLNA